MSRRRGRSRAGPSHRRHRSRPGRTGDRDRPLVLRSGCRRSRHGPRRTVATQSESILPGSCNNPLIPEQPPRPGSRTPGGDRPGRDVPQQIAGALTRRPCNLHGRPADGRIQPVIPLTTAFSERQLDKWHRLVCSTNAQCPSFVHETVADMSICTAGRPTCSLERTAIGTAGNTPYMERHPKMSIPKTIRYSSK